MLSRHRSSPNASPRRATAQRLSVRRGSVTALDPWGTHAEINFHPQRSSSSKLTIMRVADPPGAISAEEPTSAAGGLYKRHSHGHGHASGGHRRMGTPGSPGSSMSGGGMGAGGGGGAGGADGSPRLSFANQTFGRPGSPTTSLNNRPGSPTLTRPGSPTLSRPRSPSTHQSSFKQKKLTPEQVYELAKQSTNPAFVPPSRPSAPSTPLGSPGLASSLTLPPIAPASFTLLTDDMWLPFVDRPAEVSTLISNPPSARLFALLAQTLPRDASTEQPPDVSGDPKLWSFTQLDHWLRNVDRDQANDLLWIRKTRECVLAHSELIWVRLKGAFGVPPELDGDEPDAEVEARLEAITGIRPPSPDRGVIPVPAAQSAQRSFLLNVDDGELEVESPSRYENDGFDTDDDELNNAISIEPVLVPTTPPLVSSDSAGGLGGITEADEDEEEEASDDAPSEPKEIIRGLKICTSSAPARAPTILPPAIPFGYSPSRPFADASTGSPSVFQLDGSASPGTSAFPKKTRTYSNSSGSSVGGGGYTTFRKQRTYSSGSASSSGFYDVVAERGPGNPLFPSTFAQLALGPTLKANNPSLRAMKPPPPSMFPGRSVAGVRSALKAEVDPAKHEYAVTTASEGSVGGGD